MAETDAAISTSDDWILLVDARDLVATFTKSRPAAEEFLYDHVGRGPLAALVPIRCRYRKCEGHRAVGWLTEDPDGGPPIPHNRDPFPSEARFWQPNAATGEKLEVDWDNSTVHWTAPPRWDPKWPRKLFGPEPPSDFRVTQIFLHRGDLIAALRSAGYKLEPATEPTPGPSAELSTASESFTGVERWVYDQMVANPPRKGDHEYVGKLFNKRPDKKIKEKTVRNLVGRYRKKLEKD
jgi:hypothetical protein